MLRKTLLITLMMTLLLTACGSALPASGNLTFTDGLGREVKLEWSRTACGLACAFQHRNFVCDWRRLTSGWARPIVRFP